MTFTTSMNGSTSMKVGLIVGNVLQAFGQIWSRSLLSLLIVLGTSLAAYAQPTEPVLDAIQIFPLEDELNFSWTNASLMTDDTLIDEAIMVGTTMNWYSTCDVLNATTLVNGETVAWPIMDLAIPAPFIGEGLWCFAAVHQYLVMDENGLPVLDDAGEPVTDTTGNSNALQVRIGEEPVPPEPVPSGIPLAPTNFNIINGVASWTPAALDTDGFPISGQLTKVAFGSCDTSDPGSSFQWNSETDLIPFGTNNFAIDESALEAAGGCANAYHTTDAGDDSSSSNTIVVAAEPPEPPSGPLTLIDTRVYWPAMARGDFSFFVVGSAPLGAACDPNVYAVSGERTLYAVPIENGVVYTPGSPESPLVVGECE